MKTKGKSELSTGASTASTIEKEKQPLEPGKQDKAKKKRKNRQDEAESKDETLNDAASEGKAASRSPTEEKSAEKRKKKKKKKKKDKTHKGKSSSSQSKLDAASTPSEETMPQQLNVGTDPLQKETRESEEEKKEETKEGKQETRKIGTSTDKPPPTASQKDLVDSHLRTDFTKDNETQAQPNTQQVEDLSSQQGIEESQPDSDQNKLEVEVPTTNEEQTHAQVELPWASFIGALNMAQHDAIIADAPNEGDL
ncbi:hypothetical protein A2U01_0015689, partial [Trifolium medium]|nr:hypothetical protein [Trifolium medium]